MRHELETSRLRLSPCSLEDTENIHALWINGHVRRFLFDDRIISPEEARSFVEASLANFEEYGFGLWLVFTLNSHPIGFVGLLRTGDEAPQLIYGIHPDHCGTGYATEAAGAVLRYSFESLGLSQVNADVDEPNLASVRVLEKLGMKQVQREIVKGRPLLYFARSFPESVC